MLLKALVALQCMTFLYILGFVLLGGAYLSIKCGSDVNGGLKVSGSDHVKFENQLNMNCFP